MYFVPTCSVFTGPVTYYALKIAHYTLSSAQKQTVLCQNCAFKITIMLEYKKVQYNYATINSTIMLY